MTINTYAQLQSRVADFLNRQDLASVIPTFITLAEADINRRVRHYKMVQRRTSTIPAGQYRISQPTDWLEAINLQASGAEGPYRLRYLSHADIDAERLANASGAPSYYSLVGEEIEVCPTPTATTAVEQIYYGKTASLSDVLASNWILASHPDAYLYGALLHSAPYLDEDPRVAVWNAGYERAIAGMNDTSEKSMTSGGVLLRRSRTFG